MAGSAPWPSSRTTRSAWTAIAKAEKAIMKGDLIKKFLPVLDDLERAL